MTAGAGRRWGSRVLGVFLATILGLAGVVRAADQPDSPPPPATQEAAESSPADNAATLAAAEARIEKARQEFLAARKTAMPPAEGEGRVVGFVIDARTGRLPDGAALVATRGDQTATGTFQQGDGLEGMFEAAMAPGGWKLEVTAPGYCQATRTVTVRPGKAAGMGTWALFRLVPEQDTKEAPQPKGPFAAEPAFQDDFGPDWEKKQKDWRVATWKQNGTEMAPERCATDGKGLLVQTVLAGEPYRGGSMETAKEYPYGRWVARLRPSSVPGVLNSMFTMDWDDKKTADKDGDGSKFEVDIEFLTYTFGSGRGKVHLAVHVPGKSNAFVDDVALEFNPSDDFHLWGFDILPDRIVWHVDGKALRTWDRPAEYKFHPNYEMFFNSWTSPKWIKGPAKETARYQIDWVRFYPLLR